MPEGSLTPGCPKRVDLHGDLAVQLADADVLPGALEGFHVAPEHVLVEADTQRIVLDAGLVCRRHLGLLLAGAKRLDGLEEEVQREEDVDHEVAGQQDLHVGGHALQRIELVCGEEQHHVHGGQDHEREPRLVVGQVDEVDGLLERVHERAIALPGIERAVRVLEALLFLLAELGGRRPRSLALGRLGGGRGRRPLQRAPIGDKRVARRTIVVLRP
jgi:hypothetical protein